ncbi:Zn-dependent protease with chaperone function [Halovivax ruber XH-70]|uniref:Zn-dependent protease with chaperone function n=1 Tax=Halovivax ruber (strain DSM 18193 / JCM 13892 / XH-70) TaxID=797302 RepID=L0IGF4_HALRX|nr:M48 family metalloprotease [Halovivax ruber]AGB17072.1 Zn-dependent protease with chaperone function [Halovivax ruber XH-70]
MTDFGLKVRMVVVGAILFGFYLASMTVVSAMFGIDLIWLLPLGLVVLPPLQYKLGKWRALRGADDMPEEGQYLEVHRMTEALARDMEVKKPKLKVMEMGTPNAFAVGRKGAGVVCVSTELMAILDRDELEGVIAHEIAHIKNRDVITMIIGQSIGMIVGWVAYIVYMAGGDRNAGSIIVGMVIANVAQLLVTAFVLAISRYREYVADDDAREAIGSGDPLARALEKISRGAEGRESKVDDSMSALCIFNGDKSLLSKVFSTHPPMEKRIAKLRG